MRALEIKGLNFSYGRRTILRNVNLEIEHPSVVSIIGSNGSGKSTLAKIVVGQLKGDGEILVFGKLVLGKGKYLPPGKRGLAYVPQKNPVFPHLTVEENLRFVTSNHKLIEEVIELFELNDLLELRGRELSGGQAKRVSMAMALASGKKLIVMDEPLSGVDPLSREALIDLMKEVSEREGISILWITHFKEVVEKSDEAYVMKKGSLVRV